MLLVGCSGGGGGNRVKGKITLDGQPLAGADIILESRDKDNSGRFIGRTNDVGDYEVPPQPLPSAMKPGGYRVSINKYVDPKGKIVDPDEIGQLQARGLAKNLVPPEYSDPELSKLTVTVKEGVTMAPPFELKSKGGGKK